MTSIEELRNQWRQFAKDHPDEAEQRGVRLISHGVGTSPLCSDVLARSGRPPLGAPEHNPEPVYKAIEPGERST